MNILYIGDVMAAPGLKVVSELLADIKKEYKVDFTIAQAENSNPIGKGPGKSEIEAMKQTGVDFFTGGNHSLTGAGSQELYESKDAPIVRPDNLIGVAGKGWQIVGTKHGDILIASMLGQTVGKPLEISNPLEAADEILKATKSRKLASRIFNFHGDFSSEKIVFGYYLDGKVSAVIGDHWHVPTADAMIFPKGTAHITDVGMCGTLHSSIGVKTEVIIDRWKTGRASQNEMEEEGPLQFNAVIIEVDTDTGLSKSIRQIQRQTKQ